jgi:hypothetical protein
MVLEQIFVLTGCLGFFIGYYLSKINQKNKADNNVYLLPDTDNEKWLERMACGVAGVGISLVFCSVLYMLILILRLSFTVGISLIGILIFVIITGLKSMRKTKILKKKNKE